MKECTMKTIIVGLFLMIVSALPTTALAGENWSIDWSSIDGGGTMAATGGSWELAGTIGQADASAANAVTGGSWQLTGGFWSLIAEFSDVLFSDRFQAGQLLRTEGEEEVPDE